MSGRGPTSGSCDDVAPPDLAAIPLADGDALPGGREGVDPAVPAAVADGAGAGMPNSAARHPAPLVAGRVHRRDAAARDVDPSTATRSSVTLASVPVADASTDVEALVLEELSLLGRLART
jgi:hypothetical protein